MRVWINLWVGVEVKESLGSMNDVVQLWGQRKEQRLQSSNAAGL